jgi:NAD(P)-dependent dehydrogenase (short-subunit alcohol dehydrogenase family)
VSHFGRIDVWIHCAAVLLFRAFGEVPPPLFRRLVGTNVLGHINGSRPPSGNSAAKETVEC